MHYFHHLNIPTPTLPSKAATKRGMCVPHLSHGVWNSSRLRSLTLHLPSKCYCITGHDCSAVDVRAASNDGRPDPRGDPEPSPAQSHGAFGQWGIQSTAQTSNANRVFSCVGKVSRTTGSIGSIHRLNVFHRKGFTRAGEASSGAAAAVSSMSKARGAREARGPARTTWPRPISIGSNNLQLWDGTGATVHGQRIWCIQESDSS